MTPDPGLLPRVHPETAPIFRAAAGRPFTDGELDEICRVFPERAKTAAHVAELWEASATALGPSPSGAPSPRAFRAELASLGQAVLSGETEAIVAELDQWQSSEATAFAPLLRRVGRAWAENALHRLATASPAGPRLDEWTPDEWADWLHEWFGQRDWQMRADFTSAPTDGLMAFVLHQAKAPRGHFSPPLLAGALGRFGSRLSGATLEGTFVGEGALNATLPADGWNRASHGLLFFVTSPARAAEAGTMAAAGQEPGAIRAALRRTKPLPAPDPAVTGGAP